MYYRHSRLVAYNIFYAFIASVFDLVCGLTAQPIRKRMLSIFRQTTSLDMIVAQVCSVALAYDLNTSKHIALNR